MPTGYTCYIEDGKIDNAKDFIMLCARAFGACVDMRDEPLSTPIPKNFEPDTYYKQELENAQRDLNRYSNMSTKEAQKVIDNEYNNRISDCKKYVHSQKDINDRYTKVLNEVKAWNPPTSEHNNLKKFTIEQITMCMSNVDNSYAVQELNNPKPTVDEWLSNKIKGCKEDITEYTKEWNKEVERTKSINKWLKELRESF